MVFQKLQAWQDANDVTDQQLADRVSKGLGRLIHRTTISRAKRGLRVLGMDIQLELQKHAKISPADWAEFYAQTVNLRARSSRPVEKKSPVSRVVEAAA